MKTYTMSGTCAKEVKIKMNGDIVEMIEFVKGCPGSLIGIANLVKGKKAVDVIEDLRGIKCSSKPTSCPDQLALALESIING